MNILRVNVFKGSQQLSDSHKSRLVQYLKDGETIYSENVSLNYRLYCSLLEIETTNARIMN